MTRAFLSAIAVAAASGAALAQTEVTGTGLLSRDQIDRAISVEEAIDANVYSMNETVDQRTFMENRYWDAVDAEWAEIGEVEDVLISPDGQVIGLVVETGGWLDLGDDEYVIDMRDVRVVGGEDNLGFVTRLTQAEMEARPRAPEDPWN